MKEAVHEKADRDNRANQLNPNNPAYASSRLGSQQNNDQVYDGEFDKLCDSDG